LRRQEIEGALSEEENRTGVELDKFRGSKFRDDGPIKIEAFYGKI